MVSPCSLLRRLEALHAAGQCSFGDEALETRSRPVRFIRVFGPPVEESLRNPLALLAPALIPSWNFFDVIAPSPRIEFALLAQAEAPPADWREFRPRPQRVSLLEMARRLVWNPRLNETLFVVACAERLVDAPTGHSEDEIFACIAADLPPDAGPWLTFRLVFVSREGEGLAREVLLQAEPRRLPDLEPR